MRCTAWWCALAGVLLHHSVSTVALPGRRAYPAAGGPFAPSKPMAPYMTLRPFLPAKPANPFTPAFVPSPQIFMDKKTKLLSNSFPSPAAPFRRALPPAGAAPAAPPTTEDPSVFTAKKVDFLNKLFGGLGPAVGGPGATPVFSPSFWMPPAPPTTPAPADDFAAQAQMLANLVSATLNEPIATEAPPLNPFLFAPIPTTPKPTIVPPGFWLPSSPIATPGEYTSKVSEFLEKLFASKMTTPAPLAARSLAARHHEHNPYVDLESRERAVPPPPAPLNAKDMVINSILTEVAELKGALMDTVTDMVAKQKSLPFVPIKKPKILPPWVPTPPPTPDPLEPYQKRLETLGQVFDMLTGLGQEVTAPKNSTSTPTTTTRAVRSVPARSVQMAVHQGYQSMPPGTEEIISVGAGRDPKSSHEGGGLNLKIKVPH